MIEIDYINMLNDRDILKVENDSLSVEIGKQTIIYIESQESIRDLSAQINYMKNNPPNRKGDDLLNSLRNKFN